MGWVRNYIRQQEYVRQFAAGSTQYLSSDPTPITAAPFTVAGWFWVPDTTTNYSLWSMGDTDASAHYWDITALGAATDWVYFRAAAGGSPGSAYKGNYLASTWHHVAGIERSSVYRTIYLDGSIGNTNTTDLVPLGINAIAFGCSLRISPNIPMSGRLAHWAIWDTELSSAEIWQLSRGKMPYEIRQASLRGYWPLTITSQDADLWRNNYNLTATNGPTWGLGPQKIRYLPRRLLVKSPALTVPSWVSPTNHASMGSMPVLVFTMPMFTGDAHFDMQLDTANTFDTGNLRDIKSNASQTGWEYYDGGDWQSFPATGVPDTYAGNDCRYTVQTPLSNGTWYRRIRAGST